jgi:hypothetical protein
MRCPACSRFNGLSRKQCVCGYDVATNDATRAIAVAKRDREKALHLLLLGIGALVLIVAVCAVPVLDEAWTRWSAQPTDGMPVRMMRVSTVAFLVTTMTVVYAFGRGIWLAFDARRRLRAIAAMQALPAARVVL